MAYLDPIIKGDNGDECLDNNGNLKHVYYKEVHNFPIYYYLDNAEHKHIINGRGW